MNTALARLAWRLALCIAATWFLWRIFGPVSLVFTATLYGVLLAKPLIDLMSDMRHQTRALVWRPLEGRHYVFHGTPVQVIEDDTHVRWVRAADVRRIVGFAASDGALALTYPNGWRMIGQPLEPHFSDEALIAHLRKETSREAGRFMHWAERTVAYPARQLRMRATKADVE
ncbi:MAG: hypothetical protein ABI887_08540 [Burkholderiales bacterium]